MVESDINFLAYGTDTDVGDKKCANTRALLMVQENTPRMSDRYVQMAGH